MLDKKVSVTSSSGSCLQGELQNGLIVEMAGSPPKTNTSQSGTVQKGLETSVAGRAPLPPKED
jgi:hypothetical protein